MVFRKYFLFFIAFFSFSLLYAIPTPLTPTAVSPPTTPGGVYDNEGEKYGPTLTGANAEAIFWLNLVDQAQYRATWGAAADLFKDVIGVDQWVAAMKGSRQPLGTLRSRKLTKYEQTNVLPHGTKGHFMIIQFRSQFSKKTSADEIVTLVSQGPTSIWKVVNYSLSHR